MFNQGATDKSTIWRAEETGRGDNSGFRLGGLSCIMYCIIFDWIRTCRSFFDEAGRGRKEEGEVTSVRIREVLP